MFSLRMPGLNLLVPRLSLRMPGLDLGMQIFNLRTQMVSL